MREGTYRVHVPERFAGDADLPGRLSAKGRVKGGALFPGRGALVVLNGKHDGLPPSIHDLLGMTVSAQWASDSEMDAFIQWTRDSEWVAELLDAGSELLHLCWDGRYIRLDTREDCQPSVQPSSLPDMAEQVHGDS